ncbi:Flr1p DI49_5177 [Saccharomyces eubayanus]|uniref:Flr1p n=1 Tax=Saccharomyces eubayanus TaxID=1080349 RepID=UPI0006C46247|nr:hypothetical protein DI49_5177 [Saccharomyces eubayanus]KOG96835.1 hypothetical protein DI49_5177 [Saccharomyces eubayanus]
MVYTASYRHTVFVDLLEHLGVVSNTETLQSAREGEVDQSESTDTKVTKPGYDIESDPGSSSSECRTSLSASSQMEKNDAFLVDWNGESDPENPQNWPLLKKSMVVSQIMILTCVTYMGSSIYTPGQEYIQSEFKVGHVVATLNLSMYVLGYGLGPIIFSPLSEIARFGRLYIYMITLFFFMIFQIGCATVHNIGGLIVMRFISGVLCSPSLATGGGTVADIISPEFVPLVLGMWSAGAVAAPVLAPLLGAAMVEAENWRYIFWLLMWLSAATLVVLVFFFPETQHYNILYRRALKLRKETGDDRYYTEQDKLDRQIDGKTFLANTLYRPFKMIIKEPALLAFDLYIAVAYGCFYLFFEAFPIVFVGIYHFTLVEVGVAYMGFCVGCVLAYILFAILNMRIIVPRFKNGTFTPEVFLIVAMSVCWCLPLALFLFGWTAKVHWILPIISEVFFVIAVFNIFQATFAYLATCYPKYVASVFAGNSFCRSLFACAFPLFGKAMYDNLATKNYPVAWGSSLVGFFTLALAAIPFVLYKYGPALRAKSAYTD